MSNPNDFDMLSLRIDPAQIPSTLEFLQSKWIEFSSIYAFDYAFLDDQWNRMYRSEQRLYQSFQCFAFIAIFIACLGLIGLASYGVERRTKEIGIRKVVGASYGLIFQIMLGETLKIAALGTVIAIPLGYFFMNKWLENFAYRIDVDISLLALSGIAAILVAAATVSYFSMKAAGSNPVNSLRVE